MTPPKRPRNVPKAAEWYLGTWQHGLRDAKGKQGDWTAWRADGSLYWKCPYRDDRPEGTQTYFMSDEPSMIMEYRGGKRVSVRNLMQEKEERVKKIARPKLSGSAYERLVGLDDALRRAKNPDYERVVFRKVKPAEIAQAEKQLGVKLPPSYVRFVKEHGTFHIAGDGATYDKLLGPLKIAKLTLAIRKGDLEERDLRFLKDAICFQENPYDDNFYVFRVSSRRKDGEMNVGEWNHDDESFWSKRFKTFDDHVAELCEKWCDELA